ncbi:hypothetical protein H4582DRAFT_2176485 [Lactarius indigo]|nr:hypothetical protein H4582DRAFT_2176485 [Lactarius indigo]
MSSPPVDMYLLPPLGPDATSIPDGGTPVMYCHRQIVDATTICYRLLQVLMPYNVSNAAQLRGHQTLRDSAVSETYPQLESVRAACFELLRVFGSPYNVSNAPPLGGHQVLRNPSISETCPQCSCVALAVTQLKFVWAVYHRLLQIYRSLLDEVIQLREHQHRRDLAISEIFSMVALAATRLEFVVFACHQLLQVCGVLPGEYNATQLGEHRVPADNASQIQLPAPESAQSTDAQAGIPAGGDTSPRLPCSYEGCEVTFGRPQERKRHVIDVHMPRRQCALCFYEWSRPDKIKPHFMENHQDELPQEVLNEIRAKCGQGLVAFLEHRSVIL